MSEIPSYQRLFAELKRRRVFRVMTVYGIVGFVVLQVVDLAVPALLLPEWTYRLVAFLLLLGFPVAVLLAWAFEATPEGLKRQSKADEHELRAIATAPASRRWPAGLLAIAGLGLVVWGAWHVGRRSGEGEAAVSTADGAQVASTTTGRKASNATASIAVLPFVNMSSDPDQEYFSDGISEELLNLLAHIQHLNVAARTSSFAFKGQNVGIPEIAQQLGVENVLEGSVRKSGDEVRITAQLIRAKDGFHLWSKTWDRTLDDIFAIQDEIAADVAEQLQVTLLGKPTKPEVDPEAYNLVLQGRFLREQGSPDGVRQAGELFRQALAIDSTYTEAWSQLARQKMFLVFLGTLTVAEGERQATDAARHALAIDPESASAYAALGAIAVYLQNDPQKGTVYYHRALELDPANFDVLTASGLLLSDIGRYDEAIPVISYMVERDPVNPSLHDQLATTLRLAGRCDEAIPSYRRSLALSPERPSVHHEIAICLLEQGKAEDALREVALEPDDEYRIKLTAIIQHALGHETEARAALSELREKWGERWPSEVAQIYAYMGDADATFEWLDRAIALGEDGLDQQFAYWFYDPVRKDPRWQEFLDETGTSKEQLDAIEFEVPLPG
ncbi:MAG: tetratricopeptide repeat protein [Gemmatimonadales bacterium]|jgi:TolB-like protein/Tfp pilus assembly protein PilF